jgi:hypothetical protein
VAEEHTLHFENGSMFKHEHSDDTSKQGQDFYLTSVQLAVSRNQFTSIYTVLG